MGRVETYQLPLVLPSDQQEAASKRLEKPVFVDGKLRVHRLISYSQLEQLIYRDTEDTKARGIFSANIAVGSAIDFFQVPGNFIWRDRGIFCFELNDYERGILYKSFSRFYPTGWRRDDYWEIMMKYQPSFCEPTPLDPRHPQMEMRNIRDRLVPIWNEVAKKFKLDSLHLQSVAIEDNGYLRPSEGVALPESIAQIGQRIVMDRWSQLVDDDKNYSYIARPDCVILYDLNGQIFEIQVAPDYIKRLREKRKSVNKRHIAIKRILGDYKDSEYRDMDDYSTPLGKSVLVYNWLLLQIGQGFKEQGPRDQPVGKKTLVLPNRQVRKAFVVPQESGNPIPEDEVLNVFEFLREDRVNIFTPMPKLSEDDKKLAKGILEEALLASQQS